MIINQEYRPTPLLKREFTKERKKEKNTISNLDGIDMPVDTIHIYEVTEGREGKLG